MASPGEDLVGAKVDMFTAMYSHKYDIIFFIFIAFWVLLLPVCKLVLARLTVEDIVEVVG